MGRIPFQIKGNQYLVHILDFCVIKFGNRAIKEHEVLKKLNGCDLFPTSLGSGIERNVEFCIQERIFGNPLANVWQDIQLTSNEFKINMVKILEKLKENNVWHRDIRPENIIVGFDKKLYLIDFGWAVPRGTKDVVPLTLGSKYRSPKGPNDDWSVSKLIDDYKNKSLECKRIKNR